MRKTIIIFLIIFIVVSMGVKTFAIHEEIPAETQKPEQPSVLFPASISRPSEDSYALQALIGLLEKKGVITKEELLEEIEKVKSGKE